MTINEDDRSPEDNLDPDKEARLLLNPPNESVQFTQNLNATNGQVALPTNSLRSGVGMTKQELMKYANDPFWVRMRLFLFILFWVVWLAMLIGAVLIIAFAPGCPATASLPWWQKCSMIEVKIRNEPTVRMEDALGQATQEIGQLHKQLDILKDADIDAILIDGLDLFYLSEFENNSTANASSKFKDTLIGMIQDAHSDERKKKIILGLNLAETSVDHDWFKKAKQNGSVYDSYYIWKEDNKSNLKLSWDWDVDKFKYYARKKENHALLNFANEEMFEKLKSTLRTWVRTRVDGIQADGALWIVDPVTQTVGKSNEAQLELHKVIKGGGQNKAFLVTDPDIIAESIKQGEEEATSDLAPNWSVWNELSKASNLKQALHDAFAKYVGIDEEPVTNSTEPPLKEDVGKDWQSSKLQYPANKNNSIAKANGLTVAEGTLMAFYLLPKSTPVVQVDGTDELKRLQKDPMMKRLASLRRDQSESFLLGTTQLPTVSNSDVLAIYRVYKEKNGYLLLINFGPTSQEVKLTETYFPDAELYDAKIVLTDTTTSSASIGKQVNLAQIKLEPKQSILVEFALKE